MRSGSIDPKLDIPEIEVTFTNGVRQKMILRHYDAIPNSNTAEQARLCNYLGHLEGDELDSSVAITGCLLGDNLDEEMYITLLSNRSPNHKSFSFDRDGNTKAIEIQSAKKSNEASKGTQQQDHDELENDQFEEALAQISAAELSSVPPTMTINFRLGYDRSAREYFDREGGKIDNWLAQVMTHSQVHYLHSSLRHQIIFKVK